MVSHNISLREKKAILDEYMDLVWRVPGIQTSTLGYSDRYKKVLFANSEGSYIEQEKVDVTIRSYPGLIVAISLTWIEAVYGVRKITW